MKDILPVEKIENKIYLIRGQKVMLDRDLADLYGVKPIRLREQVKRNKRRFPGDFLFQLSDAETDSLVSQNAIPSRKHLGGFRPYVFTEHGAVMVASVLNTQRAVEVSIYVVKAFVRLRELAASHKELAKKLAELGGQGGAHEERLPALIAGIEQLRLPPARRKRKIGFTAKESKAKYRTAGR